MKLLLWESRLMCCFIDTVKDAQTIPVSHSPPAIPGLRGSLSGFGLALCSSCFRSDVNYSNWGSAMVAPYVAVITWQRVEILLLHTKRNCKYYVLRPALLTDLSTALSHNYAAIGQLHTIPKSLKLPMAMRSPSLAYACVRCPTVYTESTM